MNMTLRECKKAIRSFIRQHWDDQRLAEVYAFNRDGRMDEMNTCSCLIGCTLPACLHMNCDGRHYLDAKALPGAISAELAYMMLGWKGIRIVPLCGEEPPIRQRRLSAILRGELRRRDRIRRDLEWAYDSQPSREEAILKLASGVCYLTCGDIEALCSLASDQEGLTLAEMVLNPSISEVRLRGVAEAEVEL